MPTVAGLSVKSCAYCTTGRMVLGDWFHDRSPAASIQRVRACVASSDDHSTKQVNIQRYEQTSFMSASWLTSHCSVFGVAAIGL